MSRHTREELLDLAAGYALGAASPDEAAAVERAMSEMPELVSEVVAYREVAVQLAQYRAVAPPPELRDRVLTQVRETKVVPLSAAPSASTQRRAGGSAPRWLAVGLAASVAVAAWLGYQNTALRRSLDARAAQSAELQQRVATLDEKAARRERQLESLLEAEQDLWVAQMRSADTVRGPGIQFFWNAKQQKAILHAFRLRPAPAGRSYQLWLLVDGKPVSAKVFNSDPDGHALVENIEVPRSPNGVTQVLLTEEPAGGSPQPTMTPFVGGKLAKT